ncbi:hypothetical protein Agub_g15144 [Astrephomene gubernaculifera]|uniref:DUF1214 domain-containing protein n=1 Tax=Astrephomene gubernaculifera TaxID=47775 RepID=A0AAD3E2J8_9CHLO|nr:hypothetical protein Agub_g15144 [Astrephomene gubernaculifera]
MSRPLKALVRRTLLSAFGWVVRKLYNFFFLLRLYVLVLEREAARSNCHGDDDEQRRIDDGSAWLDFCDGLKGLVDFIVEQPTSSAPPPQEPQQPQLQELQQQGTTALPSSEGAAAAAALLPGGREIAAGGGDTAGGTVVDALDRREGLRYLTRVLRGALEAFVDCWDPAWPVLRPLPYNVKLGADNPDNLYMYGTVSGQYEYRLYGHRGSVTYLSVGCYTGSRPGQGSGRAAHLDSSQLVTQPDGSFEIFLTPQPRGANWLPLPTDASRLVVRQTFLDRSREQPARVAIERLPLRGSAPSPPRPLAPTHGSFSTDGKETTGAARPASAATGGAQVGQPQGASGAASEIWYDTGGREVRPPLAAGQVVAGLAGAAVFVAGSVRQFQIWSRGFAARPNTLAPLTGDVNASAWADPAIHFLHGYWRVGPGEALLLQVTPPACVYWNFQLDNLWLESMDSEAHPLSNTNKARAAYMPDGSICLVVAHNDPRVSSSSKSSSGKVVAGRDAAKDGVKGGVTGERELGSGGEVCRAEGRGRGAEVDGKEEDGGGAKSLAELLPPQLLAGVTWVSTAHHAHGTMGLRWVLAEGGRHPVPRVRLLRLGRQLAEAIEEGLAS